MNRKLMFGITAFFAVVGLALVGGEKEAFAGRGCDGRVAKRSGGLLSGGLSKIRSRGVADCCGAPAPDTCPTESKCRGAKKRLGGLRARLKARRDGRGDSAAKRCCKESCSGGESATKEESAEAADEVPEAPAPEEV